MRASGARSGHSVSGYLQDQWRPNTQLTFNLGGALSALADPDKKIKTLVLSVEPPVAGRPVKVP